MTLEELIPYFQDKHIYFSREMELLPKGERCIALTAYCPPILHEDRLRVIRDNLPKGYKVTWFPNTQNIVIQKTGK